MPYLLYAFVNNHSLETCQKIYKVSHPFICVAFVERFVADSSGFSNVEPSRFGVFVLLCFINTDAELNASPSCTLDPDVCFF